MELNPAELEVDRRLERELQASVWGLQKKLAHLQSVVGIGEVSARFIPDGSFLEMAQRARADIEKNAASWKPTNQTRNNFNAIIDNFADIDKTLQAKQEDLPKEATFTADEIELVA